MTKAEKKKKAEEYARKLEEEDAASRKEEAGREKPRYNLLHPASMTTAQRVNIYNTLAIVIAFFTIFLIVCSVSLIKDKHAEQKYWDSYMQDFTPEAQEIIDSYGAEATEVRVAVDVEEIRALDFKNSNYKICMNVGYEWEGHDDWDFSDTNMVHFYKGDTTACGVNADIRENGKNYQNVYYEATISKDFWTKRFPLGSHQLRFFIVPSENLEQIRFSAVADESYADENMILQGYKVTDFGVNEYLASNTKHLLNPVYDSYSSDEVYTMELMGQLEINASGVGTYIKCFIALFGTLAWILMCLYICTYRKVDSLALTGSAFFGAVSNIIVSASLLPDALQTGLVEYVNIFGIAVIIAAALIIIRINNIRNERGKAIFAHFYGKTMFWTFVIIILVGNIILPLSAWRML